MCRKYHFARRDFGRKDYRGCRECGGAQLRRIEDVVGRSPCQGKEKVCMMKFVFLTNCVSPHQIPLAKCLASRLEEGE